MTSIINDNIFHLIWKFWGPSVRKMNILDFQICPSVSSEPLVNNHTIHHLKALRICDYLGNPLLGA